MAGLYTLKVFDTRIAGLFDRGKDADKFLARNLHEIYSISVATCPSRRGAMKSRHGTGRGRIGPYAARGNVYNDAPYAKFVHEGTHGPIFPTRGVFLWVRAAPASRYPHGARRASVAGQQAQPWISEAARRVMARYI